MNNRCEIIKESLELFFEAPFDVRLNEVHQEPTYIISPRNEMKELFDVRICFRQNIRMIIEIEPQTYAAAMVEAMNNADQNKKQMFLLYMDQIIHHGVFPDFYINQQKRNVGESDFWNEKWETIKFRATKIIENPSNDEYVTKLIQEWAKIGVGMFLSLLDISVINEYKHLEGKVSHVTHDVYERNPVNRELCLSANGYSCNICGFDFEKKYGLLGHGFIHVHHIEMVADYGGEKYINPITDMIPVCPNCHAMLHRKRPPLKPEFLREIIEKQLRGEEQ